MVRICHLTSLPRKASPRLWNPSQPTNRQNLPSSAPGPHAEPVSSRQPDEAPEGARTSPSNPQPMASGRSRVARAQVASACAVFAASGLFTPVDAAQIPPSHELLIGFIPGASDAERVRVGALLTARSTEAIEGIDVHLIRTPLSLEQASERATGVVSVEFIERNASGSLAAPLPTPPNDPDWNGSGNWRMTRANVPEGWDVWPGRYFTAETKPRFPTTVAILDSWIDVKHRDFKNRGGGFTDARHGGQLLLERRESFVAASAQRGSADWHGTFIAGIVGGAANNGYDVAGVGYDAQLLPITVASGDGRVTAAAAASGIVRAVDRGARIINLSFAIPSGEGTATLRRAVVRAARSNALIVAAAGNAGTDAPMQPAALARNHGNVVAVSATNALDALAPCSSYGRHITIAAPGADIVSLKPGTGTMFASCGTSASAAMVSGAAAVIASQMPGIPAAEIRRRLERSADDLGKPGRDVQTGAGRLNLVSALMDPNDARVRITRPRAVGGTERATIVARATARTAIHGAELTVDPITRARPVQMRARDGRLDARTEAIVATIDTRTLAEGIHDLSIRAKDGRGWWGPSSVVPLVVDRHAPTIPTLKVEPPVVVPGDPATKLHLSVFDQLSRTVAVTIEFVDASGVVQARHRYDLPPGVYQAAWRGTVDRPGGTTFTGDALPPGSYEVRVTAVDEAGRRTEAEGSFVVSPDTRP